MGSSINYLENMYRMPPSVRPAVLKKASTILFVTGSYDGTRGIGLVGIGI